MRTSSLPPPERFTVKDKIQILFGLTMIPIGALILFNTSVRGGAVLGFLVGGAFIAFGLHRTMLAVGRLRWYYARRKESKNG
jgi:uncharacterized membrane protein HdeD (DUF308 family)